MMVEKLIALFESRRFWTAIGGIVFLLFHDVLDVNEQTANGIVAVLISWILGDSLHKTNRLK